jgi:hypothetical protein
LRGTGKHSPWWPSAAREERHLLPAEVLPGRVLPEVLTVVAELVLLRLSG